MFVSQDSRHDDFFNLIIFILFPFLTKGGKGCLGGGGGFLARTLFYMRHVCKSIFKTWCFYIEKKNKQLYNIKKELYRICYFLKVLNVMCYKNSKGIIVIADIMNEL